MNNNSFTSQEAKGIKSFPVTVIVLPIQRRKVEVKFDV